MSLLLDALKEAEARKREAAPAPAAVTPPAFEAEGALALAEDYAPPPPDASPSRTTRGPVEPARHAALASAPILEPAAAASAAGAPAEAARATTPAEKLLAARSARATAGPSAGAPRAPTPNPPQSSAAAAPVTAAIASPAAATLPPASPAVAAASAAKPRGTLPGLLGAGAALALLFGGFVVYDRVVNAPAAVYEPPAAPDLASAAPAGATTTAGEPQPQASPSPRVAPPVVPPVATGGDPAGADLRDEPPRRASVQTRKPATIDPRPRGPDAAAAPATAAVQISISREPAPLEAAWAAMQAGDLARAEAAYRQVLASEAGQVDAQIGLAVIAQSRGEDEAARRGFRRVLESVPDHPRAWAGLAELAGEGESGTIESRLRQLLADKPSAPLHFALGNVLARQQRWADAQAEYFAAATLAPQAPDYAFNVAVALERLGKAAAALPWYERSIAMASAGRAVRFDAAAVRARIAQLRAGAP